MWVFNEEAEEPHDGQNCRLNLRLLASGEQSEHVTKISSVWRPANRAGSSHHTKPGLQRAPILPHSRAPKYSASYTTSAGRDKNNDGTMFDTTTRSKTSPPHSPHDGVSGGSEREQGGRRLEEGARGKVGQRGDARLELGAQLDVTDPVR